MLEARFIPCAIIIVLAVTLSAAGQDLRHGWAEKDYKCSSTPTKRRDIQYAVGADTYVELDPETHKAGCVWYSAKSLRLESRHAYVKIEDASLNLTPTEMTLLFFDDPDPGLPIVMDAISRLQGVPPDQLEAIERELREAARFVSSPEITGAILQSHYVPTETRSQWTGFARQTTTQIVNQLTSADDDADPTLRAMAAARLVEQALANAEDEIGPVLGLVTFPFIIARRVVGGAAGTEVAVYIDDLTETTANVYLVYLYSDDPSKKVKIKAPSANSVKQIEICQFGRVFVELVNGNWVGTQVVRGPYADLPQHVKDGVATAFAEACILGMSPNPPNAACGLDWNCSVTPSP